MTITRISPGVWELRTRHGTLIATGDLHTVVNVWAKLRRSDVACGHPRADGGPTVECALTRDCRCRAYAACEPAVEASTRVGTQVRGQPDSQGDAPGVSAVREVATGVAPPGRLRELGADGAAVVGKWLELS
jgi:hypothetical protein